MARLRRVDAGEGVHGGGVRLDAANARNQPVAKAHVHARHARLRRRKGAQKVEPRVGQGMVQRQLRAGEDDGLALARQHERQRRRRVGHGVRAVGDDHAVAGFERLVRRTGQRAPFLRLHVAGIEGEHVPRAHGLRRRGAEPAQQVRRAQRGLKAVLAGRARDGAARGQQSQHGGFLQNAPRRTRGAGWMGYGACSPTTPAGCRARFHPRRGCD